MTDLVLVDRLGDINFGLPEGLAPHKKPWEYYVILGVKRDATPEEIRKAVRELTRANHPDRVTDQSKEAKERANERQKFINEIGDVLLDDGGELGAEYSRRAFYDRISGYGEFFGAVHIEHHGERTVTVAEDLLNLLELKKRHVAAEHEFKTENPEIVELIERIRKALRQGNTHAAERDHNEVMGRLAEKEGISVEEYAERQKKMQAELEKGQRKREEAQSQMKTKMSLDIWERRNGGSSQFNKMFDIWYNGERDGYKKVTFSTDRYPVYCITGFHETDNVVRMGLQGNATLAGMKKIHFKAEHAQVIIQDAHLEGIVQIVHGRVTLEYEGSSYGTVVRIRAPQIQMSDDFVQSGDLYIPKVFAREGWDRQEPKLDIAVFDGAVDLRMKKREVQERSSSSGYTSKYPFPSKEIKSLTSLENVF